MSSITTQRIRDLSSEQGRSLKYLCDQIGVKSRTYFQDIEKQQREIPAEKLKVIADALGTTTDYLLGKTDEKSKPSLSGQLDPLLDGLSLEALIDIKTKIEEIIKNREQNNE